jgi:hypothetical protein
MVCNSCLTIESLSAECENNGGTGNRGESHHHRSVGPTFPAQARQLTP